MGRCIFYIETDEDPLSSAVDFELGDSGFHVIDLLDGTNNRRCPRGDVPRDRVVLDGENECPFFDQELCAKAYQEESYCPKRLDDARRRIINALTQDDPFML